MIGIFWTCRGAGKKGMSSCLSHMIRDHSLDFVCLQETHKKKFQDGYFRKIDPYTAFEWDWFPSVGKSGGILCGVRKERFEVVAWKKGRFILQVVVYDIKIKKIWTLCTVYGAAHDSDKQDFLIELADFCIHVQTPLLIGGDFNILRHEGDKNKNWHRSPYIDMFNSVINTMCLNEIHMSGGMYTWTNNQAHPTL